MAVNVPDAKSDTEGRTVYYQKVAHSLTNIYNMARKDRGYAVIINNKTFSDLSERIGTDIDRDEMRSLLITMGFQASHITVANNCSAEQMQDIMKRAARRYKGQDCDCFVGVILSHGSPEDDGNIVGSGSDNIITVDELTKPFRGNECEALIGKPKIFFFQMCRGGKTDKGVRHTDHDAEEDECVELQVPSEADFLLAFSVVPGYLSWRNEVKGSWFIQSIVEVFRRDEQWKREDIVSLQTQVNKTVAFDYGNRDLKQMPCFNSTLTAKVIFCDRQ